MLSALLSCRAYHQDRAIPATIASPEAAAVEEERVRTAIAQCTLLAAIQSQLARSINHWKADREASERLLKIWSERIRCVPENVK